MCFRCFTKAIAHELFKQLIFPSLAPCGRWNYVYNPKYIDPIFFSQRIEPVILQLFALCNKLVT